MPLEPILPPLIAALSPSQRLANQRTGTEFGEPRSLLQQHKAESAWVLLFNAGQKNEGVYAHAHACCTPTRVLSKPAHSAHWLGLGRYTLQGRQAPEMGRGTYVLAFEQHEEACRFGMMLQAKRALSLAPLCPCPTPVLTSLVQAQGFDLATATKWTSELLVDFCDVANFDLGFVPDAALLIPPEQNVYVDHYDLIDEPKSNADVLGDADSEQVTAALLRRCRALRVGPLPVFDPKDVSRVTGGGVGLQWP